MGWVAYARYTLGRWMVHGGIWIMPPGRARKELVALLWTWNMRVSATVAAHNATSGGE